jgi:peptide/nickel transport system permease protein
MIIAFKLGLLPAFGRIASDLTPPPTITGSYLVDSLLVLDFKLFFHCLSHIIMPAAVLAASPTAMIMRLIRASMLEEMGKDYILTARANGLPQFLVTYKYMLRNAFSATLTIIGLLIGFFIGSAFVIETVFTWPGIGRYGVRALQFKDFNGIVAVTLIVGIAYSITNTIVLILYGWLDPRLRFSKKDI